MTKSLFNAAKKAVTAMALAPMRFNAAIDAASTKCKTSARKMDARRTACFVLAAVMLTTLSEPAFAQVGGGGDITQFLQNLVNIITGTAGRLIAIIAICIVGIGALMGALSLRVAGGVILGVMLIFSAAWIVDQIIGV